jgi:hypothetical protein
MNSAMLKLASILLVFLGELFAVYAETFGVKYNFFSGNFWKIMLIMCLGGVFLVIGYILGYRAFHNLWTITVVSITTLLIAEPIIILAFFHQTPTIGAVIGFILGAIGLIAALLF